MESLTPAQIEQKEKQDKALRTALEVFAKLPPRERKKIMHLAEQKRAKDSKTARLAVIAGTEVRHSNCTYVVAPDGSYRRNGDKIIGRRDKQDKVLSNSVDPKLIAKEMVEASR